MGGGSAPGPKGCNAQRDIRPRDMASFGSFAMCPFYNVRGHFANFTTLSSNFHSAIHEDEVVL